MTNNKYSKESQKEWNNCTVEQREEESVNGNKKSIDTF
jgi:hypothetical protein